MFCVNGCETRANPLTKRKTTLNSPTQVSAGYTNISPILQINLPPWPRAVTPRLRSCLCTVELLHTHSMRTPSNGREELGKGIPWGGSLFDSKLSMLSVLNRRFHEKSWRARPKAFRKSISWLEFVANQNSHFTVGKVEALENLNILFKMSKTAC